MPEKGEPEMNQVLHSIHSRHQYAYLPVMLFLVALLILVASVYSQKSQMRYVGYAVAVALLMCCVFII